MNLIYLLLRSSGKILAIAIFSGFVSGACNAQLIALINSAVNKNSNMSFLFWSFVVCSLLMVLSRLISGQLLVSLSQKMILETRLMLSRQILSAPLRYLEELGASGLLACLTEDVQSIASAVSFIPSFSIAIAIIVGCFTYLIWLDRITFLAVITFLAIGIFSYQALSSRTDKYFNFAREEQDKLFYHFRTITEGIKELKLHSQRRDVFFSEELQITVANSKKYNLQAMTLFNIALAWNQLLIFVVIGIVIFALPKVIDIRAEVMSGYALTSIFIVSPLDTIVSILPMLSKASIALKKIEYFSLTLGSRSEGNFAFLQQAKSSWQKLELIGVTHAYHREKEDSSFTLGPINLTFSPQELIFLVGGNGSGKSTLAKLLVGLYFPEDGEILVDGQTIDENNREWYRQQFSVVFSDFYLFNKLLGLKSSNLDLKTKEYLIKLQLDHKVEVKDGVFSTTALSQGQRKRLALLTTYLEDRPFYVFDEWASDQDPIFKEIFYTQLLQDLKKRGKTILVISHDDRYFHLADRIVTLDYGQIATHKQLLLEN